MKRGKEREKFNLCLFFYLSTGPKSYENQYSAAIPACFYLIMTGPEKFIHL